MKKNVFVALLLTLITLLISCNPSVDTKVPEPQVPTISVPEEIEKTIGQLGKIANIYSPRNAITTRAMDVNMLQPEQQVIDGKIMNAYHILVEYDAVSGKTIDYILSQLESYNENKNPSDYFDFTKNKGKTYIEFILYFDNQSNKLSLISMKYYDNLNTSTATRETTFSADFLYDILNQIRISDNAYKGFDWINGVECEPDRYVEIEDPAEFPSFRSPSRAWIRKDRNGTISKRRHVERSYISEIEITPEDKELFSRTGSRDITELRINGFTHVELDKTKCYVTLEKYPANYLSAWFITFYWYQNNTWFSSLSFQADKNFNIKVWKPIPETEQSFAPIRKNLEKIGAISASYQEYLGDSPLTEVWGREIKASYIVEFSSVYKDAIYDIAKYNNNSFRFIGRQYSDIQGYFKHDTIMEMKFFQNMDDSFNVVIMYKSKNPQDNEGWYTSYSYLYSTNDFSNINGISIDEEMHKPDTSWSCDGNRSMHILSRFNPTLRYRADSRMWQLYVDGTPLEDRSGTLYVEEFNIKESDLKFFHETETGDSFENLKLLRCTLNNPDKSKAYVIIRDYPPRFRSGKELWFFWFENGSWHDTFGRFTLEDYTFKWGKPVTADDSDFASLRKNLSKLGHITAEYQEYAGNEPVTEFYKEKYRSNYVVEFDSCNLDTIKSIGNYYHYDIPFITSVGPVGKTAALSVEIITTTEGNRRIKIAYKENDEWYENLFYANNDLSVINNIIIDSGESLNDWATGDWTVYRPLDKEHFPKLGNPTKGWIWTDENGKVISTNKLKCRYMLECDYKPEHLEFLRANRRGEFDYLQLHNSIYKNADKTKCYVDVYVNPDHYRHYSSLMLSWFENGKWHYTKWIDTDENYNIIKWLPADVTDKIGILSTGGTIKHSYQEFAGDEPITKLYNQPVKGSYILEYSSIYEKVLNSLIKKAKPVKDNDNIYTSFGAISADTICTVEIFDYVNKPQWAWIQFKYEGNWYSVGIESKDNFKTFTY